MSKIKNNFVLRRASCVVRNTQYAQRNTQDGFTLIELLITSSIIAMIGLAVFSTFSMGIKAYSRIRYVGLAQTDVLISFEKLERDLHNAVNFSGINFTGEKRNVSFAGLTGIPVSSNENLFLSRISYYFDTNNKSLARKENAYIGTFSDSKALASVKDIAFTYYYFDPQIQQYVWVDYINGVPISVRIKITSKGEDGKDVENARTILIPVSG